MRNDFQDSLHLRMPWPSFQHQIWIGNVYYIITISWIWAAHFLCASLHVAFMVGNACFLKSCEVGGAWSPKHNQTDNIQSIWLNDVILIDVSPSIFWCKLMFLGGFPYPSGWHRLASLLTIARIHWQTVVNGRNSEPVGILDTLKIYENLIISSSNSSPAWKDSTGSDGHKSLKFHFSGCHLYAPVMKLGETSLLDVDVVSCKPIQYLICFPLFTVL